jgi:hypothetical protein
MNTTQPPNHFSQTAENNPFAGLESSVVNAIGRDEDLQWLIDGIARGDPLAMHGSEDCGIADLILHAAATVGAKARTAFLPLDLSGIRTANELADILFEVGGRFSRGAVDPGLSILRPSNAEEKTASDQTHPTNSAGGKVFSALARLNSTAAAQGQTLVVAVGSYQKLFAFDDKTLLSGVSTSVRGHTHLAFVFHDRAKSMARGSEAKFEQRLHRREVGPPNAAILAAWIDEKFAAGGLAAAAIGKACVEAGGPYVKEIIEIAHGVFDLGRRAGLATERTIQQWMGRRLSENRIPLAEMWGKLSPDERHVATVLATLAHSRRSHDFVEEKPEVRNESSSWQRGLQSLLQKRIADVLPDGRPTLKSPVFRHWALQAEIGLDLGQAGNRAAASLKFGFQFSQRPIDSPRRGPKI